MSGRFWFGSSIPGEFRDSAIRDLLSFNGQLHFRCGNCEEVIWADITFGKHAIKSGDSFPCPNCRHKRLDVLKFDAIESRLCATCGSQSFMAPQDLFTCSVCRGKNFISDTTLIRPPYPAKLFALIGRREPFGSSHKADEEFFVEYIRALRQSPEFHQTCTHLIRFIESIFEDVYRSSPEAVDLLNVASGIMRTVFRETGNPDAAYLSIATMVRGRETSTSAIQVAVYGFNICQNVYSAVARDLEKVLSPRFHGSLKAYGIALARQTLGEFESLNEPWLGELRARLKWLLGDLLKAATPSEAEITEALEWFEAALKDDALPRDVVSYVRESALTAQMKRRSLTPDERTRVDAGLTDIAAANLATSTGIQRIQSLNDLLRSRSRQNQRQEWKDLAVLCLGEALRYVAGNDPRNMLRHSGTLLSRLVAGFAAERFDAGAPLDGMAAVEAFRSLAIHHGEASVVQGRKILELELRLMMSALLGNASDPVEIAGTMLTEHRTVIDRNLRAVLTGRSRRFLLWYEVWEGLLLTSKIELDGEEIKISSETKEFEPTTMITAMNLPGADAPPGRLRSVRIAKALKIGWPSLGSWLGGEHVDHQCLLIGPSSLGSWPIDAAEVLEFGQISAPRPTAFAPTIGVAAAAREASNQRTIERVLIVTYGGADLPATRHEIEDVKIAYPGRVAVVDGASLTRTNVLAAIVDAYDVIHFCGHGEFDYLEPMNSRIYFADPDGLDSFITAQDIQDCGTIGRRPIVILCACTSAVVLPNGANNFLGLAGALIRTGVTAIVGTRWPISDEIGVAFSRAFHRELACGQPVDRATAVAKNSIKDAGLDEWSAFMSIEG
jgi:DNA-directed RNA polymerase subunit RPC12/RpoP